MHYKMYFGFRNMTIKYGDKTILKNVSLEFPKGKTSTIIGANGSGKTSLLKTVSRAVRPSEGEAVFNGRPLKHYKPKELAKKIAYLPQVHYSPADISLKTLVSYGRYPYRKFGKNLTSEDMLIIENSMAVTDLKGLENRTLTTLSGGERQRAWIAMTICQQPEVLLLDEPITYLDIKFQLEVMELIKSLGESLNITIVMVLHDINFASRYSHYLFTIKDGAVHSQGNVKEILNARMLEEVFTIHSQMHHDEKNNCSFFIPEKYSPEKKQS